MDIGTRITIKAISALEVCAEHDAGATAWAAYDWLQINEAGLPYVALADGNARRDARLWAETATPAELECYALAALDKISAGPFTGRHIKRMMGSLWRRMSAQEQVAFAQWIATQWSGNAGNGETGNGETGNE